MKKSSKVRLVLLGGASIALTACGDDGPPKDAKFYSSVNDCSAIHGEATCQGAKAESEKIHQAEAPRFTRQQECEAQFGPGNCETRQAGGGGGGFFIPLMAGYMMGKLSSGGGFSQPVYRGPNNAAVMPSGGRFLNVGTFAGAGSSRPAGFQPAARVAPVARGGFGQTASVTQTSSGG